MIKEHIIKVSGEWECQACNGKGWVCFDESDYVEDCPCCHGTGTITEKLVTFPLWEPCCCDSSVGYVCDRCTEKGGMTPIYYTPAQFAKEWEKQIGERLDFFSDDWFV
jgi:DnaJ-class molecular chaperone